MKLTIGFLQAGAQVSTVICLLQFPEVRMSDNLVKRPRLGILLSLLAAALCLSTWSVLHANNLSLSVWGGLLANSKSEFLDGTNHFFQKGTWHIGNARRTWGETYGIKLGRAGLALSVQHTNPLVTPEEANE